MAASTESPPHGHERQRFALLLAAECGLVYAVWSAMGLYGFRPLLLLSVVLAVCVLVLAGQRAEAAPTRWAAVLGVAFSAALLCRGWRLEPLQYPVVGSSWALRSLVVLAAGLLAVGWWLRPRRIGQMLTVLGVITFGTFLAVQLWRSPRPVIDVIPVCTEAAQRLLAGGNPYTGEYSNIYEEVGWGGFGYSMRFVYPPVLLLHLAIPVGLGLDMRWLALLMQVAGLMLFALCVPVRSRPNGWIPLVAAGSAALIFWLHNGQVLLLEMGWPEPLVLLYLCLAIWAWRRSEWLCAAALVLAFCSKQTAWFSGPFFLALAVRERRWRLIGVVAALSFLLLFPFFLWDPGAFLRNILVETATKAPRPDALSWPAYFMRVAPAAVSWVAALSYLAYAAAFISFLNRLRVEGRDWLMDAHRGMMVAMFGLFLFAKLSFFNYYYILAGLLGFYIVCRMRGDYAGGAKVAEEPAVAEGTAP